MNIQNKVVYENLRKLEKQNNGKGCLLLFINCSNNYIWII